MNFFSILKTSLFHLNNVGIGRGQEIDSRGLKTLMSFDDVLSFQITTEMCFTFLRLFPFFIWFFCYFQLEQFVSFYYHQPPATTVVPQLSQKHYSRLQQNFHQSPSSSSNVHAFQRFAVGAQKSCAGSANSRHEPTLLTSDNSQFSTLPNSSAITRFH